MKLELYHKWLCPYSAKVRDYIQDHHLGEQITFHDLGDREEARQELKDLTGRTQVPCLVIDGSPLLESQDIINWLKANLAGAAEANLGLS